MAGIALSTALNILIGVGGLVEGSDFLKICGSGILVLTDVQLLIS